MALESASWIDDLVVTNPPGTDNKRQGDDHLRLIKAVLRACFPRAAKAFRFPTTLAKSANYAVLSTDDNTTFVCDTTVAFSLTLPTLASGDAGWCIHVLKTTTDANPVYLVPPSGTINGYTKVRRSIENQLTRVLWTGSVFVASRPNGGTIGTVVPFHGTTLPNGHLWPDGSTFTAADFVELNTTLGGNTKPDRRGRAGFGKDNMGGSTAGRVTNAGSGIVGTTLGAVGGAENVTIAQANLPNVNLAGSITSGTYDRSTENTTPARSDFNNINPVTSLTHTPTALSGNVSVSLGGSGTALNKMPPAIMQNEILVAE